MTADMQDKASVTEAYAAATIDDTGCEYLGRDVAQIEAIAKANGNEVIYLIATALAQAEQPIGYITPDALKQLRMGIDCQPIHKDDRHGFTVPVYAQSAAALSVEKAPAVGTPAPAPHVEAVEIIREMVRLADMGLDESLKEPEENGNFAAYERAKRFLARHPSPQSNLGGDTLELTAAEVNAILFGLPKDLRLQTTAKMANWLDERPFTELATTEASDNG